MLDPDTCSLLRIPALLASMAMGYAATAAPEPPVLLPPFVIEESVTGPSWRYAKLPGFEVLTRSNDAKSRTLVQAYYSAYQRLEFLLPPQFIGHHDVPTKLILYDENLWPRKTQEAVAAMLRALPDHARPAPSQDKPSPFETMREPHPLFSRGVAETSADAMARQSRHREPSSSSEPSMFFTDLRLTDLDEVVIFTLVPSGHDNRFLISLRSTLVAHLLGKRTPTLPEWFTTGFLGLYNRCDFSERTITLERMEWVDEATTAEAVDDPQSLAATFLPLPKLLDPRLTTGAPNDFGQFLAIRLQMELFAQWALDPDAPSSRRESFWNLVERACAEPVTEALLEESFGQTLAELEHQRRGYLKIALEKRHRWSMDPVERLDLKFSKAQPDQIARIRGDWERLETNYVRSTRPDLTARYLGKARQTLQRHERSHRPDPDLLTAAGLTELEASHRANARRLLKNAVTAGATRPRAHLELAQLMFEDLVSADAIEQHSLTGPQARPILALLESASGYEPQIERVYLLMARTMAQRDEPPTKTEWEKLGEGLRLFPRHAELAYRVAQMYHENGEASMAKTLASRALALHPGGIYKELLRNLVDEVELTQSGTD